RLQTWPQPPQCARLVLVLTSQPLAGLPSQFAKPGAQAPRGQAPLTHVSPAFARSQALLQPPQFGRPVLVLTSQPLAGFPSQFANPELQAPRTQTPFTHDSEALS